MAYITASFFHQGRKTSFVFIFVTAFTRRSIEEKNKLSLFQMASPAGNSRMPAGQWKTRMLMLIRRIGGWNVCLFIMAS
jgi:hypothetical protein